MTVPGSAKVHIKGWRQQWSHRTCRSGNGPARDSGAQVADSGQGSSGMLPQDIRIRKKPVRCRKLSGINHIGVKRTK